MNYFNGMIVKLLEDLNFINEEDRQETLQGFEDSLKKADNSKSVVSKKLNSVMKHPAGAMVIISLYAWVRSMLNRLAINDNNLSVDERFRQKIKEDAYNDILNGE